MADFAALFEARPSPEEIYQRNQPHIKKGASCFNTPLSLADEMAFRGWLKQNKVPFDPEAKVSDYDMRGFFRALQGGDPAARSAVNAFDNQMHYPDKWKTPYHESFSNESQWANSSAPRWGDGDVLADSSGRVIFRPK